ncbi:MAG: thymidine kinase [Thermoleophilia bacterium]|nr:thymidine kinase [Thermoleophilia bacterium]
MRRLPQRDGWVEVICGSMFSGKSEELLRRLRRAGIAGQNVLVLKPALDVRYDRGGIRSHDGRGWDAVCVARADEILLAPGVEEADVVAVDEAQFLDDELVHVVQFLADRGKRVIVAGLDQDFRGLPFGPMPAILAVAEFVDKLQAICSVCGAPASRTQRLVDGRPAAEHDPLIKLGATESYQARCRRCHEVRRVDNLSMWDG